jgi:hypothetical protein
MLEIDRCVHDWKVSGTHHEPKGREIALLYCTRCAEVVRREVKYVDR